MRRLFLSTDGRLNLFWRLLTYTLLYLVVLLLTMFVQERLLHLPRVSPLGALVYAFFATTGTLGLTWLYRTRVDRRPWSGIALPSLRGHVGHLLTGFAAGVALFGLVFAVDYAAGWLEIAGFAPDQVGWGKALLSILVGFLSAIVPGFTEEVIMRGYWFQNLSEGRRLWLSTLIVSLVFALLHFSEIGPRMLIFIPSVLIVSTALILSRLVTGSLWLAIGWHTAWDFAQWSLFGISASKALPPLIAVRMTGPAWLVGPSGMPEEGLVGIGVELVGTAILLIYMARRGFRVDWKGSLTPEGRMKQVA